jgi:hypothetical protein
VVSQPGSIDTLLALNEALDRLAEHAPRQAQIAELKLIAGLEDAEMRALLASPKPQSNPIGQRRKRLWAEHCLSSTAVRHVEGMDAFGRFSLSEMVRT